MCGICGRVNLGGLSADDTERIVSMMDALTHRGPDGSGSLNRPQAVLGHRRLSIIDLATGDQPIHNEDSTIWVVFNGEIYNFQALRHELQERGHTFYTQSDTEVIVHLYEELGADCVTRLRGMFALALWDEPRERLLLARDRLGKKPLYYTLLDNTLLFGSELKAILADATVSRRLDPAALDSYLTYLCVPPPRTIWQNISKLPPAHWAIFDRNGLHTQRYWDLNFATDEALSENEAIDALLDKLSEAVRLRLISDVPLGAFLSGGVDSSIVVALMSRLQAAPVKTFSIGFEHQAYNELPFARRVAEQFGSDHHEFIVQIDAAAILPRLAWYFDEPFADPSAVPTFYVSQIARQHVTVALNGDGGDESFAGYGKHLGSLLRQRYRRIPAWVRRQIVGRGLHLLPEGLDQKSGLNRLKRLNNLSLLPPDEANTLASVYNGLYRWRERLYTPEFQSTLTGDPLDHRRRYNQDGHVAAELDRFLYADLMTYLPDDLLVKADRMTMANSLEGRSPLLDHEIVEWAATLPAHMKIRGRTLKCLLRQAGLRLGLPRDLLYRYKQGFELPVADWLRGELRPMRDELLAHGQIAQAGYFRQAEIDRLMHEHDLGQVNHAERLWSLLNLELWSQTWMPS